MRTNIYDSRNNARNAQPQDGAPLAETILMIHGMFVGAWVWSNFKSFFEAKGYRCAIPTLRYHDINPGEVPNPQLGTTSLLDYADDLEKEIRQLGVQPIVMGHSMGGLLAQILGSRGLAKALVLLTPASPSGIMALKLSTIRAFLSAFTKWGFWLKPMRLTFNEAVYSAFHLLPPEEQRALYDKFGYESGRAGCEIGFWLFDTKRASRVDKSKVTCPVLVIAGAEDRMTPASVVRKVARKYKDVSTYKEFTNHAHWVLGEPGWEVITEYISGWLDRALREGVWKSDPVYHT
jgi:pimeloyl-ACP methyl ester carboxylesterase